MRKIKLPTDRTVFSTDNNGYADNERDETLVDQNLWDSEIAANDRIPDGIGEIGEDDRPSTTRRGTRTHRGSDAPPKADAGNRSRTTGVGRIATLSGDFSETSRTDADNPAPPDRGRSCISHARFFNRR